ncbi:MAG: hypothetical protein M1823_003352 [Watsoniomyces obsoletus]|nr:MAG: hypothetical protein M1823_003352 [Watsoniomyces obsoletus]
MGAEQSSDQGETHTHEKSPSKEYYQLLGVDRKATDEEIKKAYRKKALELHPDRNFGDVENATKLFAEVQTAYEVLSDPHERAWYDSHQDVLGKDSSYDDGTGNSSVGGLNVGDLIGVIIELPSITDYTDSPNGFYTTMRELFSKIAEEEYLTADDQGVEAPDYPSFGHSEDDYEGVVKPFYAVWMGFSTRKTFAWRDVYKLSEAPDRRMRRTMEKENKRHRDEGIREYNDVVRALLSRVRKRDRRYLPNRQTEEERQKALRDAAAQQAARSRAANRVKLEQQKQPEWVTGKGDSTSTTTEVETSGADEDIEEEAFECVACGKTFKSEKQFEAHEESRKHRKRVQHLRRKMQEEEKMLNAGVDTAEESNDHEEVRNGEINKEMNNETDEQPIDMTEPSINSVEEIPKEQQEEESPHDDKLDQSPKSDSTITMPPSIDATLLPPPSSSTTESKEDYDDDDDTEDDEYAPRHEVERRILREKGAPSPESRPQRPLDDEIESLVDATGEMDLEGIEQDDISAEQKSTPTTKEPGGGGKAKQKRAKKAAAQQVTNEFKCARCSECFPSRTKLFEHINALGHAQPISGSEKGKGGKNKKGKKK